MTDARRLAEHPRFAWQEGMAAPSARCETIRDGRPCFWAIDDTPEPINDPVPDLDDWPTAGALLGMLGDRLVSVNRADRGPTATRKGRARAGGVVWTVRYRDNVGRVATTRHHPSAGHAAARALLATWDEVAEEGG